MQVNDCIKVLEQYIGDPTIALPEEVFEFVSSITTMVNVDLLIYDKEGRILLSWRDDNACGQGWHIPGGIIRFKEKMETRIQKVAENELKTKVSYDKIPVDINEIIMPQKIRGHFISFLYRCYLPEGYHIQNGLLTEKDSGFLKWHKECPINMVRGQNEIYKDVFL